MIERLPIPLIYLFALLGKAVPYIGAIEFVILIALSFDGVLPKNPLLITIILFGSVGALISITLPCDLAVEYKVKTGKWENDALNPRDPPEWAKRGQRAIK